MLQKVSLSEVRSMLQSQFVELSTEITVHVRITLDNISETSNIPNKTLTTLINFLNENSPCKEYAVMSDETTTDIKSIEDVSEALNIPLDTKLWEMRVIEAE